MLDLLATNSLQSPTRRSHSNSKFSMDPNLKQPPLQDRLQRSKTMPHVLNPNKVPLKQKVYYMQYIPYDKMVQSDIKKYLGTYPATRSAHSMAQSVSSNRRSVVETAKETAKANTDSHWVSATKNKPLKVFEYHLAEMSLNYRCSPSLLSYRQRIMTPLVDDNESARSDGFRPRPNSPLTNLDSTYTHSGEETKQGVFLSKTEDGTQTKAAELEANGMFSDRDSNVSGPDIISRSDSNKLLNFMSVDECHVTHRLRKNRTKDSLLEKSTGEQCSKDDDEEDPDDFLIRKLTNDEMPKAIPEVDSRVPSISQHIVDQKKSPAEISSPQQIYQKPNLTSNLSTLSKISKKDQKQNEREQLDLSLNRAVLRNQLLRDKMTVYLDWKLHQEKSWREMQLKSVSSKQSSHRSRSGSIRQLSAKEKVDKFGEDLMMMEEQLALEEQHNLADNFEEDDVDNEEILQNDDETIISLSKIYQVLDVDDQ